MTRVDKTTPSQDILLGWLAGIIDGEGSIGAYSSATRYRLYNVTVVNTDLDIIARVKEIYDTLGIYYSVWERKPGTQHKTSHAPRKLCYDITVRRKEEVKRLLGLIHPYLVGAKRIKATECLGYIDNHPEPKVPERVKVSYEYVCVVCENGFELKRKRPNPKYCSQACWHKYAVGSTNPNYRHGKRISGVTTEREAPLLDEATV